MARRGRLAGLALPAWLAVALACSACATGAAARDDVEDSTGDGRSSQAPPDAAAAREDANGGDPSPDGSTAADDASATGDAAFSASDAAQGDAIAIDGEARDASDPSDAPAGACSGDAKYLIEYLARIASEKPCTAGCAADECCYQGLGCVPR